MMPQEVQADMLMCSLHNKSIGFGCMHKKCGQQRSGCFVCIKEFHNDHMLEVKQFDDIKKIIENNMENTNKTLIMIHNFAMQTNQVFNKIKEQLSWSQNKFNKFPDMNKSDINYVLEEVVNYSIDNDKLIMEQFLQQIKVLETTVKETLNKIEVQRPQVQQPSINFQTEMKIQQLNQLVQDRNITQALSLAEEIISYNPRNEEVLIIKANIFHDSGEFNKSIQIFEQILSKNPQNQQVQKILGPIYLNQCNFIKALGLYQQLYFSNSTSSDYALKYGRCLTETQQFAEAYTIYLQLDSQTEQPNPNVKFYLGNCLFGIGETQQAISYWTEAVLYNHSEKDRINDLIESVKEKF